jgi:hypothetical protein
MIKKIISGGQTGADRGGLEAGAKLGLATGGHCPKNYKTEIGNDFSLKNFGLICTVSDKYPPRTNLNIQNSDGTVVFGKLYERGSALTIDLCKNTWNKPVLELPLLESSEESALMKLYEMYFVRWASTIGILNVAGNRESVFPGIQKFVEEFLVKCIPLVK